MTTHREKISYKKVSYPELNTMEQIKCAQPNMPTNSYTSLLHTLTKCSGNY